MEEEIINWLASDSKEELRPSTKTYLLLKFIDFKNRCEVWYRISGADELQKAHPNFFKTVKTKFDGGSSGLGEPSCTNMNKDIVRINKSFSLGNPAVLEKILVGVCLYAKIPYDQSLAHLAAI